MSGMTLPEPKSTTTDDDELPPPLDDGKDIDMTSPRPEEDKRTPIDIPEPTEEVEEEGTPEYIRKRYFPSVPRNNPNLDWIKSSQNINPPTPNSAPVVRFDLQGNPIPESTSLALPTHLGLHHHAEGSHAGYTLDDIFLLSRSTVPAQRASMLGLFARVAKNLSKLEKSGYPGMEELAGQEEEYRKRIIAAGLEALAERGSVGAMAIEAVWECVVEWDQGFDEIEEVEARSPLTGIVEALPLDSVIPQLAAVLGQGDTRQESALRLLAILQKFAQLSNRLANAVAATPNLVATVLRVFLLMSPSTDGPAPEPLALSFLRMLALASRANAMEIKPHVDSLLRFIAFIPSSSPYSANLSISLFLETIRLYTVLGSYGIGCYLAGAAIEPFARLEQYILSAPPTKNRLKLAWVKLVETWTTCAIDPHQTTPPHDIRWSQVVGWSWSSGIADMAASLTTERRDWMLWSALWNAQAAFLEGSRINGVHGGEMERSRFLEFASKDFQDGKASQIIARAISSSKEALSILQGNGVEAFEKLSIGVDILTAGTRLWLACLPPRTDFAPSSPPFILPFNDISRLASQLLKHPLWSSISNTSPPKIRIQRRHLSRFLALYINLSKRLPETTPDLWMAQIASVLLRLGSGDEDVAFFGVTEIAKLITPAWAAERKYLLSDAFWQRGGFSILKPFLEVAIRPTGSQLAPLSPSTTSIQTSTTQRLAFPPASTRAAGLPLNRDWALTTLDHLLRSSDSPVFKSLPDGWDASEVEVTRASLFLASAVRDSLVRFSLEEFSLSREEAVFGLMKVFMLEHDQTQTDSSDEVFRDNAVEKLMQMLLGPFEYGSASSSLPRDDLEKVAARFLGESVPLYQYYTDFVALYDSISFSHPIFARLLLAPISMRYAVDYRKYLWADSIHLIRTIHVEPEKVLSGDLKEYLYPIEDDPQVVGSYLAALLKNKSNLDGICRLIVVHHIAANIWADLFVGDGWKAERASHLLKAVVEQGDFTVVREIVHYRQTKDGPAILPPTCFSVVESAGKSRQDFVKQVLGSGSRMDQLQGLFQ